MKRLLLAAVLGGALTGCGDSAPATAPDNPEALRRAEEEAAKEAQREKESQRQAGGTKGTNGKKGDRVDRGED